MRGSKSIIDDCLRQRLGFFSSYWGFFSRSRRSEYVTLQKQLFGLQNQSQFVAIVITECSIANSYYLFAAGVWKMVTWQVGGSCVCRNIRIRIRIAPNGNELYRFTQNSVHPPLSMVWTRTCPVLSFDVGVVY